MPIFSSEEISQALFQIDPFHTGCKASDRRDEYDIVARGVYAKLWEGFKLKEALVLELVEWFFEQEGLGTDCLDPVVAHLLEKGAADGRLEN